MGQALSTFVSWISGKPTITTSHSVHFDEKSPLYTSTAITEKPTTTDDDMATQLIHTVFTSPSPPALQAELQNTLSAQNWTETLATAILTALTKALEISVPMGKAVKEAFEKASKEVGEWARENPELATLIVVVIALGILVVVMPWVIDALGFKVVGPRLGESDSLLCFALLCFAPRQPWEGRRGIERAKDMADDE